MAEKLKGLRGWLIFYQIYLWIAISVEVFSIILIPFFYFKIRYWKYLNILLCFPYMILGVMFIEFATNLFGINTLKGIVHLFVGLVSLSVALIWIAYFFSSKRVKNTFVN